MAQQGRKPGDGRGRLGGRAKGTPNKDNPLKGYLAAHSLDYFRPTLTVDGDMIQRYADLGVPCPYPRGASISQFDLDLSTMGAADRVDAEIKLLNYHTPKMQAATIDMTLADGDADLDQRLADLAQDPGTPD